MIRSAIWLAAALIVGAAFHAFTPKASACSCPELTIEEELERADAVFLGELASIRRIGQFPRDSSVHENFTQFLDVLEFKASEIWKGHPYETIYVHADPWAWGENANWGHSCSNGYMFAESEGERFIVFVSNHRVTYGLCGSSTYESQGLNYFAVYGVGRPPEPGSVSPMPPLPADVFSPSAGRCGLPLHSVSNYGDTAALIMIVGLPGLARLISRRRTRTSSRDA